MQLFRASSVSHRCTRTRTQAAKHPHSTKESNQSTRGPGQTIAWMYLTAPGGFVLDALTSMPLSWVDWAVVQARIHSPQNSQIHLQSPARAHARGHVNAWAVVQARIHTHIHPRTKPTRNRVDYHPQSGGLPPAIGLACARPHACPGAHPLASESISPAITPTPARPRARPWKCTRVRSHARPPRQACAAGGGAGDGVAGDLGAARVAKMLRILKLGRLLKVVRVFR